MFNQIKEEIEMKRIIPFMVMAALLVFSTSLIASEQRVRALGGNAGMWPDDDENIDIFPSTINNWNLAQTDGSDFKVIWGDDSKIGFRGGDTNDLVNLYCGMGTMGLIFGLNRTGDTDGTDAETAFSAAVGAEMSFGEVGVGVANDPNGTTFGANLRREQDLWLFSHALVGFGFDSPDEGDSEMNLGLDLFTHLDIARNTTGLFAVGFGWDNVGDGHTFFPNLTFGVESNMTDWATLRCGFTKAYNIADQLGEDTVASFGLGFNYGGFQLDLDIDTDLFTNPVQKVTGFQALGSTMFNITYSW